MTDRSNPMAIRNFPSYYEEKNTYIKQCSNENCIENKKSAIKECNARICKIKECNAGICKTKECNINECNTNKVGGNSKSNEYYYEEENKYIKKCKDDNCIKNKYIKIKDCKNEFCKIKNCKNKKCEVKKCKNGICEVSKNATDKECKNGMCELDIINKMNSKKIFDPWYFKLEHKRRKHRKQRGGGNYIILQKLGQGSYGQVFIVKENSSDKRYVLKVLPLNSKNLEIIPDELKILQIISKNKCKKDLLCYHDHFIDYNNNTLNIITDMFENSITLTKFIISYQKDHSYIDNKTLLLIMKNLLSGLIHLHKLGIAHGDIKPDNILIDPDFNIQYIDFGVSCYKHCIAKGTHLFSSPNQLMHINKEISVSDLQRADIFSLGIVFYLLANYTFPFPIKGKIPYQLGSNDTETDESGTESESSVSNIQTPQSDLSLTESFFDMTEMTPYVYNDPDTIAYSLMHFYKNRLDTIISFYGNNDDNISIKINEFIEYMLKEYKEKSKTILKHLLSKLNIIINLFNLRNAHLGSRHKIKPIIDEIEYSE